MCHIRPVITKPISEPQAKKIPSFHRVSLIALLFGKKVLN
jgi:hypothetical protein